MTSNLNDATMIVACKEGDTTTVTDLLSKDPDYYTRIIAWADKDQKELETPPILIAVDYGQLEVVRLLVESRNADIDILDSNDYTPLQWASWNGNEEIVKLFLAKGARVDQGALDLAKEYDHKHIISLLIEKVDFYSGLDGDVDEIMIKASREGDVKKVQELIAEGYDFKKWKDDDGTYREYSPIYVAMKNGHVDIIREFLQAGVEAELHSTHFHYPEEARKPAELTEEQIAAIIAASAEEEEEEEEEATQEGSKPETS